MRNELHGHYFVIFSGVNDRAIYALVRTLSECGENFVIVAKGRDDKILDGKYKKHVCSIRFNSNLNIKMMIYHFSCVRHLTNNSILTVIPTSEYLNKFLLENKYFFENYIKCRVPLVDKKKYSMLTNKWNSQLFFKAKGIQVPNYDRKFLKFNLPFVAKPYENIDEKKQSRYPIIIRTVKDFNFFLRNFKVDRYFFQDYIQGESYYLLTYFSRDGNVFITSQKNIAQQPGGKSILISQTDDFFKNDVCIKTIENLKEINFFGFAMIEFICNSEGDYFIELNPRP